MTRTFTEEWEDPPDLSKPRSHLGGLSPDDLAAIPFEGLGRFKQAGRFPAGYSRRAQLLLPARWRCPRGHCLDPPPSHTLNRRQHVRLR